VLSWAPHRTWPPEQASGNLGEIGPACDVYSLGTILYALTTGRPPFQDPSAVDTVLTLLDQEPLPPRLLNRNADRELEMIILRCLQKPPDLRYRSAAALADDLAAYLSGNPTAARSGCLSHTRGRLSRETHHATVLELIGGSVFVVKAGILNGSCYLVALALFATSLVMAWMERAGIEYSITVFGLVSAAAYFLPDWKYYRRYYLQAETGKRN